jgi:hypothetical protein
MASLKKTKSKRGKSDSSQSKTEIETETETETETRSKWPLKSVNNKRCLTPCYEKFHRYIHPIFLTDVTASTASCAIEPTYSGDVEAGIDYYYGGVNILDKCRIEDNEKYLMPNELESMLLGFFFDAQDFLFSTYDIRTFDDTIKWTLNNTYLPFGTIKRAHNCSWKVFGTNPSSVVIDYYYNVAVEHWLDSYLVDLKKIFSFDIDLESNLSDTTSLKQFIIKNYFTKNFFSDTLRKFIETYESDWNDIYDFFDLIKFFTYDELTNKISGNSDDLANLSKNGDSA